MEAKNPLNVIVTGVGGQGNVLIAQLIGRVLVAAGHHVTIGETYGASQRGGAVMSHLRISQDAQYGPLIPEGGAHVILGLEPLETLRVLAQYGNPEVTVIANSRPVHPLAVTTGAAEYPSREQVAGILDQLSSRAWLIDATDIALDLGAGILTNVIMLGALVGSGALPAGQDAFEGELRQTLPADKLDVNLQAFRRGILEVTAANTLK
jgi:indolepyruvate ferredoxin oxidoreductase beta subunit